MLKAYIGNQFTESEFSKAEIHAIHKKMMYRHIAWAYLTMELIDDYSENPFEGLGNDIPMLSLCRVIEIDLKEMLGETDVPGGGCKWGINVVDISLTPNKQP